MDSSGALGSPWARTTCSPPPTEISGTVAAANANIGVRVTDAAGQVLFEGTRVRLGAKAPATCSARRPPSSRTRRPRTLTVWELEPEPGATPVSSDPPGAVGFRAPCGPRSPDPRRAQDSGRRYAPALMPPSSAGPTTTTATAGVAASHPSGQPASTAAGHGRDAGAVAGRPARRSGGAGLCRRVDRRARPSRTSTTSSTPPSCRRHRSSSPSPAVVVMVVALVSASQAARAWPAIASPSPASSRRGRIHLEWCGRQHRVASSAGGSGPGSGAGPRRLSPRTRSAHRLGQARATVVGNGGQRRCGDQAGTRWPPDRGVRLAGDLLRPGAGGRRRSSPSLRAATPRRRSRGAPCARWWPTPVLTFGAAVGALFLGVLLLVVAVRGPGATGRRALPVEGRSRAAMAGGSTPPSLVASVPSSSPPAWPGDWPRTASRR